MDITFNKRELAEFYNFNIRQSELPRIFAIKDDDPKILEVLRWLNKNFYEGWKVDDWKPDGYYVVVNMTKKRCPNLTKSVDCPVLSGLEFKNGIRFEDVPYVTNEEVEFWMEQEKHLKVIPLQLELAPE